MVLAPFSSSRPKPNYMYTDRADCLVSTHIGQLWVITRPWVQQSRRKHTQYDLGGQATQQICIRQMAGRSKLQRRRGETLGCLIVILRSAWAHQKLVSLLSFLPVLWAQKKKNQRDKRCLEIDTKSEPSSWKNGGHSSRLTSDLQMRHNLRM